MSIAYDAPSNSYSVTADARILTFAPADVSVAGPVKVYTKTAGATTNTLSLVTYPTATNGTPYKYVAAGFLQSTTQSGATASATLDAFTFGITTGDASVPRTGGAGYAINMNGVIAPNAAAPASGPISIQGSGALIIDFGKNTINTNATFSGIAANGASMSGNLSSSATLPSSSNGFSGSLTYFTQAQSYTESGSGILAGRFYGPAADEVGGTFYANSTGGSAFVGTILGAPDANLMTAYDTLASLNHVKQFSSPYAQYCSGNLMCNTEINFDPSGTGGVQNVVQIDPATSTYTFNVNGATITVGPSQLSSTQDDLTYTKYGSVNLYKLGSSNPEIALTYADFADILGPMRQYVAFGMITPSVQFPKTGTLTYSGILRGSGVSQSFGSSPDTTASFDLTGTSQITVQNNTLQSFVTLNPIARNLATGVSTDLGPMSKQIFLFATRSGMEFQSVVSTEGVIAGAFFGPNAEEAAGTFIFKNTNGGPSELAGVFAAKKH